MNPKKVGVTLFLVQMEEFGSGREATLSEIQLKKWWHPQWHQNPPWHAASTDSVMPTIKRTDRVGGPCPWALGEGGRKGCIGF